MQLTKQSIQADVGERAARRQIIRAEGLCVVGDDLTPLRQALSIMERLAQAISGVGHGKALLDVRALGGRCKAAEFEVAARASIEQFPASVSIGLLDDLSNVVLCRRWSDIGMEHRRNIELFSTYREAMAWLAES